MPNLLGAEQSPYLLQHADNPVDWHPWGREALELAQQEDKPILVSIGYSACHWCHVMAHESFENQTIADVMNRNFVNIKVDREERPDVDAIYMEAVQALSGQGGWPLNVFLTPDGRPFYGGTYFPPRPRHGLPGWPQVLESIAAAYRDRRDEIQHNADILTDYVRRAQQLPVSGNNVGADVLEQALREAVGQFDRRDGGLGSAPKFPQPLALEFLLRMAHRFGDNSVRDHVLFTLRTMCDRGLYDQLAGGFHRYSVDAQWIVPHFEKMLYDNALLARVYLQAYQLTHDTVYRDVVEGTLDYLLREMRSPEGAFYSAEDADSEGEEGKFYVWTPEEIETILGPDEAAVSMLRYGVAAPGNFDGKTILTVALSIPEISSRTGRPEAEVRAVIDRARRTMLEARAGRVPPGKDTKILTAWNALAVRAFAEAGRVLHRPDYLRAAERAAEFVLTSLRPDGSLQRSYKDRPSGIPAFLEDYAYLVEALISLYEATFRPQLLNSAVKLAQDMLDRFSDESGAGLFDAQPGPDEPVVRPRSFYDNPIPSGNSSAAFGLQRLAALTGEVSLRDRAEVAFRVTEPLLRRAPLAFAYLLSALDFYLSPTIQIAIVGDPESSGVGDMVDVVVDRYLPNAVLAVGSGGENALLADRVAIGGQSTAYVCQDFACQLPVTDAGDLERQLESRRG